MTTLAKPKLWVPGDWNAFFGFGTNILVNVLTLTGLLRFVIQMPDEMVFGRILPAVGLTLCLSTFYYAWLGYDLARRTGRNDVCALPSGPSVGHMFIVVFVIMLPIKLRTGDPIKAWEAGLTWVCIQSVVLVVGGFLGRWVRQVTPRAALLGALAGVSITFISMRPVLQMFLTPVIGLVCFAILLVSWFGGVKYFRGLPAGLIAMAVGMLVAWGSGLFGLNYGGLSLAGLTESITQFGFSVPLPAFGQVFSGFEFLGVLLVTAMALLAVWRKVLLANLYNRRIWGLTMVAIIGGFINDLIVWHKGLDSPTASLLDAATTTAVFAVGALAVRGWIWSVVGVMAACTLAAAASAIRSGGHHQRHCRFYPRPARGSRFGVSGDSRRDRRQRPAGAYC